MVHSLFQSSKIKRIVCSLLLFVFFDVFAVDPVSPADQPQPIRSFSVNKDFITKTELVQVWNPLQKCVTTPQAYAELIRNTIKGRNLMVVEDANGPAIIVTGIGPRYHSVLKASLEEAFSCPVLDVVDLLPIELLRQNPDPGDKIGAALSLLQKISGGDPVLARAIIRDTMFAYRMICLGGIINIPPDSKPNMAAKNFALLRQQLSEISGLPSRPFPHTLSAFLNGVRKCYAELGEMKLNPDGSVDITSNIQAFRGLRSLELRLKQLDTEIGLIVEGYTSVLLHGIESIFDCFTNFANPTMLDNAKQAIKLLAVFNHVDLIKNICSLSAKTIAADLSGIAFADPAALYALGHLLHSEPLAVFWYMRVATNPSPYMYTQRGMCETCNPFVISAMYSLRQPMLVISDIPATRPGRITNIEIDSLFLKDSLSLQPYSPKAPKYIVMRARMAGGEQPVDSQQKNDPDLNAALEYEADTLNRFMEKSAWHMLLSDFIQNEEENSIRFQLMLTSREAATRQAVQGVQQFDINSLPASISQVPDRTEIEFVDPTSQLTMRARVLNIDGTRYLRIPVPTCLNMCGLFALGLPPTGTLPDQLRAALERGNALGGNFADDSLVWGELAQLYHANIHLYRNVDGVLVELSVVGDNATRDIYVFGEPGHYNALVPITDVERIKEFISVNNVQQAQGWAPLFSLNN